MSRTDFEAAYIERYGHRPRGWNDDFQVYQDAHANGAWFGWQAGAAGIEAKAAPVGERDDERAAIHQLAFELGGTEGGEYLLDADDLDAVIDAAYQRQSGVVMPDVSAMAKVLSDRAADACNIDRTDNWALYGQEYIDDVQAILEVARLNGAGSHE